MGAMRLIALLRVKDGEPYLADWLSAVSTFADEVVVVDNGSTDATMEILSKLQSGDSNCRDGRFR